MKITLPGLLLLLFIGLKLTGYIAWSWWWVLGPIWVTPAVVVGIMLLVVFFQVLFYKAPRV